MRFRDGTQLAETKPRVGPAAALAEIFLDKKLPPALPWRQVRRCGNHLRVSYETELHFQKTPLDIEPGCSLAGLAGVKASGEENTVRGNTEITLGPVRRAHAAPGRWSGYRLPRVRATLLLALPHPRLARGPPCPGSLRAAPI